MTNTAPRPNPAYSPPIVNAEAMPEMDAMTLYHATIDFRNRFPEREDGLVYVYEYEHIYRDARGHIYSSLGALRNSEVIKLSECDCPDD